MQGILSTKEYDTKNNQIRKNNVKLDLREEKKTHIQRHIQSNQRERHLKQRRIDLQQAHTT